jgi:predicted RecA/RadA family phage recombinase
MKGYVQPGEILEFIAPTGGVTAGVGVKIGDVLVIATETVAQTLPFRGIRLGVVEHAKLSAQAWTEGQQVNWDDTNKRFTTVTTGNFKAGVAARVAVNPSATGFVVLHGVNLGAALA